MQEFNLLIELDSEFNARLSSIDLNRVNKLQKTSAKLLTLTTRPDVDSNLHCQQCYNELSITVHLLRDTEPVRDSNSFIFENVETHTVVKEEVNFDETEIEHDIFTQIEGSGRLDRRKSTKAGDDDVFVGDIVKTELKDESNDYFYDHFEDDNDNDDDLVYDDSEDSVKPINVDIITHEDYENLYKQENEDIKKFPYCRKLLLRDGSYLYSWKKTRKAELILSDFDIRDKICDLCGADFNKRGEKSIKSMIKHRKFSHLVRMTSLEFICPGCNMEFENRTALVRHSFVCRHRNKVYLGRASLIFEGSDQVQDMDGYTEIYQLIQARSKNFPYFEVITAQDSTVLYFTQNTSRSKLYISIVDFRSLVCDLCNEKFKELTTFLNHRKSHFVNSKHNRTCLACNRHFLDEKDMLDHSLLCKEFEKVKPDVPPPEMEYEEIYRAVESRPKSFPFYDHVTADDGTELHFYQSGQNWVLYMCNFDPRPQICNVCSLQFKNIANFMVHRKKHFLNKRDNNTVCGGCQKRFEETADLVRHTLVCKSVSKLKDYIGKPIEFPSQVRQILIERIKTNPQSRG